MVLQHGCADSSVAMRHLPPAAPSSASGASGQSVEPRMGEDGTHDAHAHAAVGGCFGLPRGIATTSAAARGGCRNRRRRLCRRRRRCRTLAPPLPAAGVGTDAEFEDGLGDDRIWWQSTSLVKASSVTFAAEQGFDAYASCWGLQDYRSRVLNAKPTADGLRLRFERFEIRTRRRIDVRIHTDGPISVTGVSQSGFG